MIEEIPDLRDPRVPVFFEDTQEKIFLLMEESQRIARKIKKNKEKEKLTVLHTQKSLIDKEIARLTEEMRQAKEAGYV